MTLVAFASAKGSPGVSHAVSELARLWPRDVAVADLDPSGGDAELLLRDQNGDPLTADTGLVSLGAALRGGKQADLGAHLQVTADDVRVLVGVNAPGQMQGLGPVWPHLASTLSSFPADVLADCGRFTPGSPVQPVIESAAAVVFVARHDLPSLAHLRERLIAMREPLSLGRAGGTPVGIALLGDPRDQRAVGDMVRLFASAGLPVEGLGTIAHDPRAVKAWWSMSRRAQRRSVYHRSLVDVAGRVCDLAGVRPTAVTEEV
jgi:MinD-like ATPase involved in chromosome partitioning or flagellar assembly